MPYVICRILAISIFFAALSPGGLARSADRVAQVGFADIVSAFDQAILQGQSRVSKWPLDRVLRVKVTASLGTTETQALKDAIGMLDRQTRLTVRRDDRASEAELIVELVDGLGMRGVGIHNVGRTHSSYEGASGEMQVATISLARDWAHRNSNLIHRTLPHEMLHAVGFHGHAPDGFDSVMTAVGGGEKPTAWDLLFLKVLYDERLRLGTPRIFALPIACRLLHERLVAEHSASVSDLRPGVGPHPHCADLASRPVESNVDGQRGSLAWAYLHGLGVARDLDEAEKWARRAKAEGDRNADYLLYRIEQTKR
jgi:hypothetical protein